MTSLRRWSVCRLALQDGEEEVAERPRTKDPEEDHDDRYRQRFGHDKRFDDEDVHDDRAEDGEPERDELLDDDEQATDHLHHADEVDIAGADHAGEELAGSAGREGLGGNEVEDVVGAAKDEESAEEDPGDEGGDFQRDLLRSVELEAVPQLEMGWLGVVGRCN